MLLLIHEDGLIEQVPDWDVSFQAAIEAGILEVVRFENGKYQGWEDGEWREL